MINFNEKMVIKLDLVCSFTQSYSIHIRVSLNKKYGTSSLILNRVAEISKESQKAKSRHFESTLLFWA